MEKIKKIFLLFLLTNLFLNYDSGVIPASLIQITKEINLGYKEQALLGSLVYLGLSATSLFSSPVIAKYGAKLIITLSVLVNSISCFIFSMTLNKLILFSTRFLMGMSQAFLVIYGPIWVNNYSPKTKSSTWMGLMHSCTIFGLVMGYLIAGLIINLLHPYINWRFSIQIQAIAEIPLSILIFLEKDEFINIQLSTFHQMEIFEMQDIYYQLKKGGYSFQNEQRNIDLNNSSDENDYNIENIRESGQKPNSDRPRFCQNNAMMLHYVLDDGEHPLVNNNILEQAKIILGNKLYLYITLALCSIYFIVTSIQYWMTSYFIEVIEAPPVTVVFAFSFVTVTGPLSGILIGGWLSDNYGGYKGENVYNALQMALGFGFLSFVFTFPIGFIFSFTYITILIWTFLFFGAAIVPIATGIMISCIPRQCQATSSSLSQLIFNLGGYFLSPVLTGFIMDFFEDKKKGFIWGVRIGFWWVIFSVSLLFLGCYEANKNKKKDPVIQDINVGQTISEVESMGKELVKFIQIEIKRRIALSRRI